MSNAVQTVSPPASAEVAAFVQRHGLTEILPSVVEMTQQIFPGVSIALEIDEDPEIANDRHLVILLEPQHLDVDAALDARFQWHRGLFACCPAPLAPHFRLGLELHD